MADVSQVIAGNDVAATAHAVQSAGVMSRTPDMEVWDRGASLPTPFVAVHLRRLTANLERVASIAHNHHVALRPHVKTHKCIEIARMQLGLGAVGITAAKPEEALVFINAGVPSVTVAYPIVAPQRAQLLLQAAERHACDLRFVVDSHEGVDAIALAVHREQTASLLLEIDVGLERCGVRPESEALAHIAGAIQRSPRLRLRGILSHAGHAYAASGKREIAAIADDERSQMKFVVDRLSALRIEVEEVSVGSTPTVLAAQSFDGVTEIRPGNYVFLDSTACRLGVAHRSDLALAIVSTVVSVNPRYCILDAGSKMLSSDTGPHGSGGSGGGDFGLCMALGSVAASWTHGRRVVRLSEEHGFVVHGGEPLTIGTRVLVFPNHACPVVNLADHLVVLEPGRDPALWAVAARGKTT